MAGVLIQAGQEFVIDAIKQHFITSYSSGLYIGLMTTSAAISETAQLPTGITEITGCSGYARQFSNGWVVTSGVDPYMTGSEVTFNVSGTWASVNGYFAATTLSGYNAVWAEVFPADKRGNKYDGDRVLITPKYEQKDDNE